MYEAWLQATNLYKSHSWTFGGSRYIYIIFVFEEKEKKKMKKGSKKQGLSFYISLKKSIKLLKQLFPKAIKYATFLVGTS